MMGGMTNTMDPRVIAAAKAWDKHMGGRYAPDEVEELAEEVAVILAAADAVDPRKPRTITTEAELDALPKGVVIHSDEDGVFERGVPYWRESGSTFVMPSEDIALPATVLWEPEA